jgi:hypothetical protein
MQYQRDLQTKTRRARLLCNGRPEAIDQKARHFSLILNSSLQRADECQLVPTLDQAGPKISATR